MSRYFDEDTKKLLSIATQIAEIFEQEAPEIRPEFLMMAICIDKHNLMTGLIDYASEEIPEFRTIILADISESYGIKLPNVIHRIQKLDRSRSSFCQFDLNMEKVAGAAEEDWNKIKPGTKEPIAIDYFLGAFFLCRDKFEVLDLALMDCDFSRDDMFAYLSGASDLIDGNYPREDIENYGELEDFDDEMEPKKIPKGTSKVPVRRRSIRSIEAYLKRVIIDQDEAIRKLVRALKSDAAGLKDPKKPIGVFLFAGKTGVGKTELATQLANATGMKLKRFDMSEYVERHSAMRLYGAPPSYVGYEQGGQLTNFVSSNPSSVIILDEIEKAHASISDILLQIAEEGALTDGKGKLVKFDRTVIILTTNVGSKSAEKGRLGFSDGRKRDTEEAFDSAIKEFFRPEVRGRLTASIIFADLSPEAIKKITSLELKKLSERISISRKIEVRFSIKVREYITKVSRVDRYGARNIKSNIENLVGEALADYILQTKISRKQIITVSYREGKGFLFSHRKKK